MDGLDLATFEGENVHAVVFDMVAGGRHPQEFALVCGRDRPAHSDLVQFSASALDSEVDVGKGVTQVGGGPGDGWESGGGRGLLRDKELEIGCHDLFEHVQFALVHY